MLRTRPPLPIDRVPEPPPKRGHAGLLWLIWLGALIVLVLANALGDTLRNFGFPSLILVLVTFFAALVFTALCMYGFGVAVRWTLRKLFWRVGRRLFLSYVMLGVFPFFLFAILLLTIGYMMGGVMTHAALTRSSLPQSLNWEKSSVASMLRIAADTSPRFESMTV